MLRLFLSFIALQFVALLSRQACATPWEAVSLQGAITESELVVFAEVVEARPMFIRARRIEVFKGEIGVEELVVTGFNRACWPIKERERHTMRAKERYLFFLKSHRTAAAFTELSADPDCPAEPTIPKAWRNLSVYTLPSPSLGHYLVERSNVYSDSSFCSDCTDALAAASSVVFPLLRALAKPAELGAVATAREVLNRDLTVELVRRAQTEAGTTVTLSWLLLGQLKFGSRAASDAVLLATRGGPPEIRSVAVRALPSLGPQPEVFRVLEGVLKTLDIGGELHVRATTALTVLDRDGRRATDAILATIGGVEPSESVLRDAPVPGLGRFTSARETMVRALTQYRAVSAEPTLLALLQRPDNQPGTLDALLTHFFEFPSAHSRAELVRQYRTAPAASLHGFHRYFVDTDDEPALDIVFETMLRRTQPLRDLYELLRYYALHRAPGDPRLEASVHRLLDERRSDSEIALLLPLALQVQSDSLIRALLGLDASRSPTVDPKTAERVARAVLLKRSTQSQPEQRMREWLQLLIDDRWSGYATPQLLKECVCSTPDALLPQLKLQLELEQLAHLATIAERVSSSRARQAPLRGAEFSCAQGAAPMRQSLADAARSPKPLEPTKGGCGAGCSLRASERRTGLLLGWLLIVALVLRRNPFCGVGSRPANACASTRARASTS